MIVLKSMINGEDFVDVKKNTIRVSPNIRATSKYDGFLFAL